MPASLEDEILAQRSATLLHPISTADNTAMAVLRAFTLAVLRNGVQAEGRFGVGDPRLFQLFLVSSSQTHSARGLAAQKGFTLSSLTQYRCEICGTETSSPVHWFMIRCNANELKVLKWNSEEASIPDTRHFCGEAHAGVYISRWLEASCSPSRPDYNRPSAW